MNQRVFKWGSVKMPNIFKSFFAAGFLLAQNSAFAQATSATTATLPATTTSTSASKLDADVTKKYTGTMKFTTLGRAIEDQNLKSTVGWTFIEAGLDTEVNEWLTYNIAVLAVFGEGAGQNYLSDEGGASNLLLIDGASVNIKPWKPISLKAGIIGYQINPVYTTMTSGTSIGAEQKLELAPASEVVKLTLQGTQAVPSVGVTKGLVEEEKNPFFLAGAVVGELKAKPINTTLKVSGSQFRFGNLPKSQAAGSLTGGNSVNAVTGTGGDLQYVIGFSGTETAAQLETDWTSNFKTTLKGVYIKNDRAFEDTDEGRMLRADVKLTLGNVAISPNYTLFDVQADVTPASYTILNNRFNNRKGQRVGLNVDLIKQKVGFFANYMKAEEIVDSPYLSDREIFNLGVEVGYDLF